MKYSGIVLSVFLLAGFTLGGSAAAHAGAHTGVSFGAPKNHASVPAEFKVEMQVAGMTVQPAGEATPGAGHFHLIIDGKCVRKGSIVPKDATHLHFGKGQTETTLKLAPGRHKLTLQFANGLHQSYGAKWCKSIHVTVK
jgi:Domain of unknown function (DUF4399)